MSKRRCAGCQRRVHVGGNRGNFWRFDAANPQGITLELRDESEHFLCFDCVEALPEEPAATDVASLPDRKPARSQHPPPMVGRTGLIVGTVGVVVCATVGAVLLSDTTTGFMLGGAIGAAAGLLVDFIE